MNELRRVYGEHGHVAVYRDHMSYYKNGPSQTYRLVKTVTTQGRAMFVLAEQLLHDCGDRLKLHGWRDGAAK